MPNTLVDLLRSRAAAPGGRCGYTWLSNGETEAAVRDAAAVDAEARAIAVHLAEAGLSGQRVALVYPPGLEFISAFFGCLYAGVVAVPLCPPLAPRDQARFAASLRDCRPAAIGTTEALRASFAAALAAMPGAERLAVIATDTLPAEAADRWQPPAIDAHQLAHLQYTSGSTANPRGVMIAHANVLDNLAYIAAAGAFDAESVCLSWLPHFHDMGLVYGALLPLFVDCPTILFSPAAFIQRPMRWLEAIAAHRVTHTGGPNFAYDLCVRRADSVDTRTLDLRAWRVAFNGAEPIQSETLSRFCKRFKASGFRRETFYPVYGLAEATLEVTSPEASAGPVLRTVDADRFAEGVVRPVNADHPRARVLVGSGACRPPHVVAIVDPQTRRRAGDGAIGEVWVAGPCVAQGFWKQPQQTADTFQAYVADTGEGPFLRTGDLGAMLDGELFVTGRLKDMIVVRGLNHYPQDIERTVHGCHAAVRPGGVAAFAVEGDGTEQLVVVAEIDQAAREAAGSVAAAIRHRIAEGHELHAAAILLIPPGELPKTTSGKLQRQACRQRYLSGDLPVLFRDDARPDADASAESRRSRAELRHAPAERREALVLADLQASLARAHDRGRGDGDPDTPLVALGLDSLAALTLAHDIERQFGLTLQAWELLDGRSLRRIAADVRAHLQDGEIAERRPAAHVAPRATDETPLSEGQRALWFLQSLSPETTAFHLARAAVLHGDVDLNALRRAIDDVARRHEALRTTIAVIDGLPVARILDPDDLPSACAVVDATAWDEETFRKVLDTDAYRPFAFASEPPFQVIAYRRRSGCVLLFRAHHLVVDLWSIETIVRELGTLYEARRSKRPAALPPHVPQVSDAVRLYREINDGPQGERDWRFWHRQLDGDLPVLAWPRTAPGSESHGGGRHLHALPAALAADVERFARAQGVTVFSALLAAFGVLLHRYTDQRTVLIGSPTHGRAPAGTSAVVGYLVNPVAIRAELAPESGFASLAGSVHGAAMAAVAHAALPFATIVERLAPPREGGMTPLFQTMFVLQRAQRGDCDGLSRFALQDPDARMTLAGLELRCVPLPPPDPQVPLMLTVAETRDGLTAAFEFSRSWFEDEIVEAMARHFVTLAQGALAEPGRSIADLPLLTAAEQSQLVDEWNATARAWPDDARTVHAAIAEQAARTPDAVAVCDEDASLSYGALWEAARAGAAALRARGVGPDVVVGLCAERSIALAAGLLAILEADGVCLPLDPELPRERRRFMAAQGRAALVWCDTARAGDWNDLPIEVATLEAGSCAIEKPAAAIAAAPAPAPASAADGASRVAAGQLAYVLFTSGSTGQPKGAMNTHRGLFNRIRWMQDAYRLDARDVVLQKTSISFDVAMWEFCWPLTAGARLVMARPGGHRDPAYLVHAIQQQMVTTVHFVPSMLRAWIDTPGVTACRGLRRIVASGEALTGDLCARVRGALPGAALHNLYGPTEAAIDVTAWTYRAAGTIDRAPTGAVRTDAVPTGRPSDGGPIDAVSTDAVPIDAVSIDPVPIGRPIANTEAFVLDDRQQLVPVWRTAELYLGGIQLARGYVGQPRLTAERFVPHPFREGARLYRTGDRVRYAADGTLQYLGRTDAQVKIRGMRVELGEIEAGLAAHPAIADAAVIWQPWQGDGRLVAFVVWQPHAGPAAEAAVRDALAARLPSAMIPAIFVACDELPRLASGKIARGALRPPDNAAIASADFVAPGTPIERALAAIWCEVLSLDKAGIHDNFFQAGGHSVLAMRLVGRVRAEFDVDVPLAALFGSEPTIAGLADCVEGLLFDQADKDDIASAMTRLEGMPSAMDHAPLADGRGAVGGASA